MIQKNYETLLSQALATTVLSLASVTAGAVPIFWTDWTTGGQLPTGGGFEAAGTITTPTSTVDVTYTNPRGVGFYQPSGGIDYWAPRSRIRDPATSPYTGSFVDNIPTGTDIVALRYAGSQTLSFSEAIANPVFSYVSLNGNGYAFDQDFEILSFGDHTDGNDCGYWGCGTSSKNVVDLGGGNFEYQLLGTGEPHGTLRFTGAFDTVTWRSLSNEFWNGFTVGVQGTEQEVFPDDPPTGDPLPPTASIPEPSIFALLATGLLGFGVSRRRRH